MASLNSIPDLSPITSIARSVVVDGVKTFELDILALASVLRNPEFQDYPVVIYSVSGLFRTGKSFLLSLLKHYLQDSLVPECDQATLSDEIPNCFKWKNGVDRDTEGIYILSRPLLTRIDDDSENKAAVFLMDTQGIQDLEDSTQNSTFISTVSFLLSSLQCINVINRIDSHHLDLIYQFGEMAQKIKKQNQECSPFQKNSLTFIVRDWDEPGYEHGFSGGKKYIEKVLKNNASRAEEHSLKQRYLKENFGELPCLLLPHPGPDIKRKEKLQFSDLKNGFADYVKEFISKYIPPGKDMIKKMNGREVTCGELCGYMESYLPALNEGMKDVESFIKADMNGQMSNLISKCANNFIFKLAEKLEEFKDQAQRQTLIENTTVAILEQFDADAPNWSADFASKKKRELENLLFRIEKALQDCLKAEECFMKYLKDFCSYLKSICQTPGSKEEVSDKATRKKKCLLGKLQKEVAATIRAQCSCYFEKHLKKVQSKSENEVQLMIYEMKAKNLQMKVYVLGGALVGTLLLAVAGAAIAYAAGGAAAAAAGGSTATTAAATGEVSGAAISGGAVDIVAGGGATGIAAGGGAIGIATGGDAVGKTAKHAASFAAGAAVGAKVSAATSTAVLVKSAAAGAAGGSVLGGIGGYGVCKLKSESKRFGQNIGIPPELKKDLGLSTESNCAIIVNLCFGPVICKLNNNVHLQTNNSD